MELIRRVGLVTGIFIIVADMIGTGVFMTTGNVLGMTGSAPVVLALWAIGGLVAISGALCYAELATRWPEAGGEYVYLKRIFGPLPAFLTGWISLVIGFSAPVAVSSLLLVQYIVRFLHGIADPGPAAGLLDPPWLQKSLAACLIVFFGGIHAVGVKQGSAIQNWFTAVKLLLVVSLIILGFSRADWGMTHRLVAQYAPTDHGSPLPRTGLALLIVMYAYSGWNCAAYLGGEIRDPRKNLPRALLFGTLISTVLYALLNTLFLLSADGVELAGRDEVGAIAVSRLFGPGMSAFFTLAIACILLSSVSAQMMAGPRVTYAMAKDGLIFRRLAAVHPRFETPHLAILVQTLLAVLYVFTGSGLTLVVYMGFALGFFPLLSVAGLLYLRRSRPERGSFYRVPCYPVTPLLYLAFTGGMMLAAAVAWTRTSAVATGVVLLGVALFRIRERTGRRDRSDG